MKEAEWQRVDSNIMARSLGKGQGHQVRQKEWFSSELQEELAIDLRVERKDYVAFGLERCVSGVGCKECSATEINAASHRIVTWEA